MIRSLSRNIRNLIPISDRAPISRTNQDLPSVIANSMGKPFTHSSTMESRNTGVILSRRQRTFSSLVLVAIGISSVTQSIEFTATSTKPSRTILRTIEAPLNLLIVILIFVIFHHSWPNGIISDYSVLLSVPPLSFLSNCLPLMTRVVIMYINQVNRACISKLRF